MCDLARALLKWYVKLVAIVPSFSGVALSTLEHRVFCSLTISYTTVMAIMGIVQRGISCTAAYNYDRRHGSASASAISIFRIVLCRFSVSLPLCLSFSFTPPSFCAVRGHCYREGIDANPWQRSDARDRRVGSIANVSASLILVTPLAFINQ